MPGKEETMLSRLALVFTLSFSIACGGEEEIPCYKREVSEKIEFIGFLPSIPEFCVFKVTTSYLCGSDKVEIVNKKCTK